MTMEKDRVPHIAVIAAGLDEEYQNNIIRGINSFVKENNINVSYFSAFGGMLDSKRFDAGEYSIYNVANFDVFDGAVLLTNTINDQSVRESVTKRVKKAGIPAVVFDCDDEPEFYNIRINNRRAMEEMVRHVIQHHGARVLNYISGPMQNPEARDRLEAFRSVLAENGLEADEERIFYGEFRTHDGKRAIEEFSASGLPMPDAFICANDAMALTALSALERLGYRVPEDVIVTGFDNTYNAQNYCPALSSVARPLFDSGRMACRMILDVLAGKETAHCIDLEASPVFTESCGCSPENSGDLRDYKKRTYKKLESNYENTHSLNILTAKLADAETDDALFSALGDFVPELQCERFTLCLSENWHDTYNIKPSGKTYEDIMTVPLIWDKGIRIFRKRFMSVNMFPVEDEDGGNINYFLPLHFRERCFGYCIITNSDFPIESLQCHSFSMNISNSIENIRKIHHINLAVDELNRLYVIDPLSALYNRNGFIKLADEAFNKCAENKTRIMMSFIDMDGLKFINDNYGHDEGDFAIQRLSSVINECKLNENSICARFGGDEFVIFDMGVEEGDDEALKSRIEAKLDQINVIISKPYDIAVSIGSIIVRAEEGMTLYRVIKKADELMYEVKKGKKHTR